MTPSERLRKLLDERGVEWEAPKSAMSDMRTIYSVDGWDVQVDESGNGWFDIDMTRYADTPEQVIAATLPESDAGGAFDEERYSRVCRLLDDALTTMSEWGT